MRPIFLVPGLALVACSDWKAADATGAESAPPDVFVNSPTLGSTWEIGSPVLLEAVVSDDIDAPPSLGIEVRSDVDGLVAQPLARVDGVVSANVDLQIGVHVLTMTVTDSSRNVSTFETTIRVVDPTAPSQPVLALTNEDPVTGEALHAELVLEAVDPTGFPVTYAWSWSVDGAPTGITGPDVPGYLVRDGQVWTVRVVGSNGAAESPPGARSVTVGNAPATGGAVALVPAEPSAGVDVRCQHGPVSDAEGDAFSASYAWTVDGVDLEGETGDILTAGVLARGRSVSCSLVVEDPAGVVVRHDSSSARVGNTAPELALVSIDAGGAASSPGFVTRGAPLRCVAEGIADADLDPVSIRYAWFVDGVAAGSDTTLGGDALLRGQTIHCEVTPFDGEVEGATLRSERLTVGNTGPGAAVVAFVQDVVVPGIVARCEVVGDAADADGDTLIYRWRWTVDGATVPGTTAAYDTRGLDVGAILGCEATPDDGYAYGPVSVATVTVTDIPRGDVDASEAWLSLRGSATGGGFGKALDRVPDFDGDGLDELVVSAPRGDGATRGAAYVFTGAQLAIGGALSDADAPYRFIGNAVNDFLGTTRGVAGSPDADGDGLGELLLAAPFADLGGTDAGSIYLLHGGGTGWTPGMHVALAADATFRGSPGDWLGARMAAGDVDGDGFGDVLLSAPYSDLVDTRAGAVALFRGSGTRRGGVFDFGDADAVVTGDAVGAELGWSLDVMGDVDGDGYPDVGIGILYDDTNATEAGAGIVVSGGRLSGTDVYDDVAFLVVRGSQASGRFGYDLSGIGDVDGDGFEDVAFGSYLEDSTGRDHGVVRVAFGAAGLDRAVDDTDLDVTITGAAGAQLGSTLTDIGDMDGDGLSDLFMGAPRAAWAGASAAGMGSVYSSRDVEDWSYEAPTPSRRYGGGAADDWFTDEVAGGFDVDSDGYRDLAIGAQQADVGATGGGGVWVFRGP